MKVVAFVPIKLKSQRLKNKMRLPLGNKMLFQHIFDKLLNVKHDLDIYCYCSDNSIEKDLLETESVWKVYTWTLPVVKHTINILGTETTVISQTYHAYESCCIKKYKEITGHIPLMCDNCDPIYIKKPKNKIEFW